MSRAERRSRFLLVSPRLPVACGALFFALLLPGFRLYVAQVFVMSGLTKTRDWSNTVALFTDEYHVPVLSPPVAAVSPDALTS